MMKQRALYKLNTVIIILIFNMAIFSPLLIGVFSSYKTTSELEKRQLALIPDIPKTKKEIQDYPGAFNNYYSDHFGLRDWFNNYYNLTKYRIGDSPSKDVILGKNNWLFLGSIKKGYTKYSDPIGDVRNVNLYSQQELEEVARYMTGVNTWLNNQGIKYIFLIAPNKHTIYFDQLPDYITKVNKQSAADQLINYLKQHTDIHVIDVRKKLIKEKDNFQMYYKNDTHWNHHSANLVQYEIFLEIEKLFPGQVKPELFRLDGGIRGGLDLANMLGFNSVTEYEALPVFDNLCLPDIPPLGSKEKITHTLVCDEKELNAVIFRDSFFALIQQYTARNFKRSTYIWERLNYPALKTYIQQENPDIIIEEVVERNLPYLPEKNVEFTQIPAKKLWQQSNELIFSNDWKSLDLIHLLNQAVTKNVNLELVATNGDPNIIFPELSFRPDNKYVLLIKLVSSIDSKLQVFYSDTRQSDKYFSEKNSSRYPIKKGHNELYIFLDHPYLGSQLRLDPVSSKGDITIEELIIKRVSG